jgi:putative membrane protein
VPELPPLPERETLRLHQANERTFLAWVRTALAMMGFGFVVARFGLFLRELANVHPNAMAVRGVPWSLTAGVALTALGALTVLGSLVRFHATTRAIERHEVGEPPGSMWVYVAASMIVFLGAGVAILLVLSA